MEFFLLIIDLAVGCRSLGPRRRGTPPKPRFPARGIAACTIFAYGLLTLGSLPATARARNTHAALVAQTGSAPPADFGAPPSGEIPILFNDHHVYAKPDRLKANRVLAALVRGNTILVPLRSMFEQTGATVSYDPASKTVDVSKPGSDVNVTVGRPEVVINGESRPLDVPPEMYQGTVVVPLRVISEGMGAYVQWVPERKTVVVRYIAAPPPPPSPAPVPTQAPTAAPTPFATPTSAPPRRQRYEHFVAGDYLFDPKVFNEFSPGNKGVGTSFAVHGGFEFKFFGLPLMVAGDGRSYHYPHDSGAMTSGDQGYVTVIGGYGQTFVPAFLAREIDVDGRLGVKLANPRIYLAAGYLHREDNYGYPKQNGVGFGLEKLPDLDRPFSLYGSAYYYPSVSASFVFSNQDPYADANGLFGSTVKLTDRILKYDIGGTFMLAGVRSELGLFLDGGFLGDSIHAGSLAPANAAHRGGYLGLGVKF